MSELTDRLRRHDDERLYHEADVLMSEAADRLDELEKDRDQLAAHNVALQQALEGLAYYVQPYKKGTA